MQPLLIIEPLDILEQFTSCMRQVAEFDMIRPLGFKRAKKRLGDCIIPAVSLTAHALDTLLRYKRGSKGAGAVLHPLIRVDHEPEIRPSFMNGLFERGKDQLMPEMITDMPADHAPCVQVDKHDQIQPSGP